MGSVTTPFGRRQMTLALVRRQKALAEIKPGKTADKWKVFRDTSAAFDKLGLQSNTLAVLDALLSFYPESVLRQDAQMIVFPSNVQLCLRAHSMAGATLRRHLAVLVEAGLIVRKDSANGKRYARKDKGGSIESAFGFDLSPLLARADEIAILAQEVATERATFRKARENLTICRRDVRKLISAAIEEGAEGDWQAVEDTYVSLIAKIPRTPSLAHVVDLLDEMERLHAQVLNMLEFKPEDEDESTNDALIEQHIQNTNPESIIDLEERAGKKTEERLSKICRLGSEPLKAFPLRLVLKACPAICDYGPGGVIGSWREMTTAAVVVRSMLGVTPSAYQDACDTMGPENAAVAMACILERATFITSAGGYLRDLTKRTKRGEFSFRPMVLALLKSSATEVRISIDSCQ